MNHRAAFAWSDDLQYVKQQSIVIYHIWKMVGKPRVGLINYEHFRIKYLYKKMYT